MNSICIFLFLFVYNIAQTQDLTKLSYRAIDSMTVIYYREGAFEKAIPYMQAGRDKARIEFGEMDSIFAQYTADLGFFYDQTGQYLKAEPLYLQAIDLKSKVLGEEHPSYAQSLNNLASLYKLMGSYDQAESLYLQAKNIRAKVLGEQHQEFATSLNDLASLYQTMGKSGKAEQFFLQAKDIRAKALGEQHPLFANSLNNLAALYASVGDNEKAKDMYLRALNIRAKVLGPQHPDFATSLNNLAVLYRDLGDYKQAMPLFMQAKNIWAKALGKKHPNFANCLNNIAFLYKNMGETDTALHYCGLGILALSESMDANFNDWANLDKFKYSSNLHINRAIGNFLSILHDQYKNTGQQSILELHYQVSQAAMRLNERIRNDFIGESDKLRSLETNSIFVLESIRTGIRLKKEGYQQAAFGFAEMNKGVLLMDAARTEKAYQFGDLPDSLALQEKDLQKKHTYLEAKLLQKRHSAERDSLLIVFNKTKQEITNFTKMLRANYPKYVAAKYENKITSAAEIQALLTPKMALLEYLVADTVLYVFYLDKKEVSLAEINIKKDSLSANIKKLHQALSNYQILRDSPLQAYKDYTALAHWFYQTILQKTLSNKNDIEHLIIITDGALGYLPFETFLMEPAPVLKEETELNYANLSYLIKKYKISYDYSATLWKENTESKANHNNQEILGMAANYNVKRGVKQRSKRFLADNPSRDLLSPLPSARQEVEILSKNFSGYFVLDDLATEREFKSKAHEYGIIHLAMHGLLDRKRPILSSLVFTEDGDSIENNFLQAFEISKMKLNADLVVLSACETGYGKFEKGNGTASLARALMYAGVPSMVVSLWEVNDTYTATLMQSFYNNLSAGMDKAEALRQAKLDYIKNTKGISAHPAFWSAFIQMGNSGEIAVAKKRSGWVWGILGGGVLLGIVLVMIRLRQKKQ